MKPKHSAVKTVVSLIGIDYNILMQSGGDNIEKFYLCGLAIVTISIISFLSVFYAFDLMFHKWYAEVLLSTFFSLTFLTIYLLLIQTFSKERLPKGYKTSLFSTSNITRTCFVFMISFLIAQPVRIYLLEERLNADIELYRARLYKDFAKRNEKLYRSDLSRLNGNQRHFNKLADEGAAVAVKEKNRQEISGILQRISEDNEKAFVKIHSSDFFLQRIRIAGKYPVSWLISLTVMLFFALPVLLIMSISGEGRYYVAKKKIDHGIIDSHYTNFKKEYRSTFLIGYGKDIAYHETCLDPPYNWQPIPEPIYGSEDDFKKEQG
jgi:hypothetical protein